MATRHDRITRSPGSTLPSFTFDWVGSTGHTKRRLPFGDTHVTTRLQAAGATIELNRSTAYNLVLDTCGNLTRTSRPCQLTHTSRPFRQATCPTSLTSCVHHRLCRRLPHPHTLHCRIEMSAFTSHLSCAVRSAILSWSPQTARDSWSTAES